MRNYGLGDWAFRLGLNPILKTQLQALGIAGASATTGIISHVKTLEVVRHACAPRPDLLVVERALPEARVGDLDCLIVGGDTCVVVEIKTTRVDFHAVAQAERAARALTAQTGMRQRVAIVVTGPGAPKQPQTGHTTDGIPVSLCAFDRLPYLLGDLLATSSPFDAAENGGLFALLQSATRAGEELDRTLRALGPLLNDPAWWIRKHLVLQNGLYLPLVALGPTGAWVVFPGSLDRSDAVQRASAAARALALLLSGARVDVAAAVATDLDRPTVLETSTQHQAIAGHPEVLADLIHQTPLRSGISRRAAARLQAPTPQTSSRIEFAEGDVLYSVN